MDHEVWANHWHMGRTPWDLGGPSANLAALLAAAQGEGVLAPGAAVLEPGCGRAHNGAALAGLGYLVTSFDVVADAVAAARGLYGSVAGLTVVQQDALVPVPAWRGHFDAILDRAMLCALPPPLRRAYVDACFSHLKVGGYLLTIPFTALKADAPAGPPFQVTMLELSELLLPGFALIYAEERPMPALDAKVAVETLCIWRRRARTLVEAG